MQVSLAVAQSLYEWGKVLREGEGWRKISQAERRPEGSAKECTRRVSRESDSYGGERGGDVMVRKTKEDEKPPETARSQEREEGR